MDRSSLRSYHYTQYKGSRQHLDYKLSDKHVRVLLHTHGVAQETYSANAPPCLLLFVSTPQQPFHKHARHRRHVMIEDGLISILNQVLANMAHLQAT